jgi:tumor protein p53-inducible protein 3
MKAVVIRQFGSAENLSIQHWEKPTLNPQEILVKVRATALNRADLLQREGKYPPPQGSSPILGLEIAGDVVELGSEVGNWKIGDKVFGLLSGGGYAEYASIHQLKAMPILPTMNYSQAVAIPEAYLTAYQALNLLGYLQKNETVLIHAGASGVGTAAIQLAKSMQARVITTSSASKVEFCKELGADLGIDYQSQDFKTEIKKYADGRGVDLILDFLGAAYFQANLDSLAMDGRLVILGLMGGFQINSLNLTQLLQRRTQITASTLRSRSLEYHIELAQAFWQYAKPLFEGQVIRPIIDKEFSWEDVVEAHKYMESNQSKGKIVLHID